MPQGSVLGPLLFLIYINDIQNCSDKLKFYLFADDTNILYADKNIKSLELTVNRELQNLYNWLTSNKLTLNIKKCNYIIFHPYQKKITDQPEIKIFDNEQNKNICLERKDYIKYLGVIIDKNLSWKYHIDNIVIKISKTVGLIAKLRHYVPFSILLKIYHSLILPYLSYGVVVWGFACKSYLNKILVLQKRALRFMYFANSRDHAVPFFVESNILPLNFLYYESVSNLMHDINNNITPPNILNFFTRTSSVHSYNTRSSTSGNLYPNKSRLQLHKHAFSSVGIKLWNEIPKQLRELPKRIFKRKLRQTLFEILKEEDSYVETPVIIYKIKTIKLE